MGLNSPDFRTRNRFRQSESMQKLQQDFAVGDSQTRRFVICRGRSLRGFDPLFCTVRLYVTTLWKALVCMHSHTRPSHLFWDKSYTQQRRCSTLFLRGQQSTAQHRAHPSPATEHGIGNTKRITAHWHLCPSKPPPPLESLRQNSSCLTEPSRHLWFTK